jgi:peptidylprolyl isomerase
MRRTAALLPASLLIAGLALAGCGNSKPSSSASSSSTANASVTVTGAFDKAPTVKIPAENAGKNLVVKTLVKGTGPTLTTADALVGNYNVYIWSGKTNKLVQSTYKVAPAVFAGTLLPGLQTALQGKSVGSRVLAVIPPKYGYGSSGNPQAGVKATDTLVFVVDMVQDIANTASASGTKVSTGGHGLPTVSDTPGAPTITIPKGGKAPTSLVAKTLIQGTGPVVTKGQTAVVQYVGVIWRTGKVFDSSWKTGAPFGFVIGATPTQVIPGWNTGLLGKKAGSRVLLSIPPADGYGKAGSSQAGIKGTDTLVFAVDILASFSPAG